MGEPRSEPLSPACQPRGDGANGTATERRDLMERQLFDIRQEDDETKFLRELHESCLDVACVARPQKRYLGVLAQERSFIVRERLIEVAPSATVQEGRG